MEQPGKHLADEPTDCPRCGNSRIWRTANCKGRGAGRRSFCRSCATKDGQIQRARRRPDCNANEVRRRATSLKARSYELWYNAKARARKENLEFDVTRQQILEWLTVGLCQITGIPFVFSPGSRIRQLPFTPTLDRRNPAKGYIFGNVRLVCWMYNAAKGSGTDDDVLRFARALHAVTFKETTRVHGGDCP